MDPIISKFLRQYYVDGVIHTHVSLINPKGKFQLNRQDLENFWNLYCKMKKNDPDDKLVIGLAEKAQHYLPILADVDIKLEKSTLEDETPVHLYTEKNVIDTISIYQSVIRNIIEDCTDDNLLCVLLEKPVYSIEKNGVEYLKNGFHLHFPNCFLSKTDQEIHLIPRIKDSVRELCIFENLGVEDSSDLIDAQCCKVPWLVYGARKSETACPYRVTKIFNSNCKEVEIEEAFKYYNLYDMKENLLNITGKAEEYLPRILSIIPNGRNCSDIKTGLQSHKKEKQSLEKASRPVSKLSVIENLKISEKLIPLLAQFRADTYIEWMTMGWILYSIGEGCDEAFNQWIEFSSRSDDFDEDKCVHEWERMVKKDFTLGTLHYYAKLDNEKLYNEFKVEQTQECLKTSIEGSHHDIAKLLYIEYGTQFVCASIANKTWYQFIDHRWEEIEEGVFLRELISNEVVKKYIDEVCKIARKMGDVDKAEAVMYSAKLKQIQKMICNLKNSGYKSSIMKEACEVFYNKNFKQKLDTDPFLIGMKNGVYDLKTNEFRAGKPEDYISKQMPINYIYFDKNDDRVKDVQLYLEKVFPDTSLREYFLDNVSDLYVGGNNQKIAMIWSAEGDNAKSVTQTILERMLGPYAIKISTALLTSKKAQIGTAAPEMSRAGGGVRWIVFEEPGPDEEINCGIYKALAGNDSFWARDLFEKGKSVREIFPLYIPTIICNDLPRFMGGGDKATWNRTEVLPFESTFVRAGEPCPETYEEQLREKRFPMDTDFYSKINGMLEPFAWVLFEHRKQLKTRIKPEKVRMATMRYRKQNDIYRQFIEECITDSKSYIYLDEINATFREWYKDGFSSGSAPPKNKIKEYFTKLWDEPERGCKWYGYKIRTIEDDVEEGNAILLTQDDLVDYEIEEDIEEIPITKPIKERILLSKKSPPKKETRLLSKKSPPKKVIVEDDYYIEETDPEDE